MPALSVESGRDLGSDLNLGLLAEAEAGISDTQAMTSELKLTPS